MAKQSASNQPHIHMAMCMWVAAQELHKELRRRLLEPELSQNRMLGIPIPLCWLCVFGIEVGIKALLQDTEGLKVVHRHELDCLWEQLPASIQETVEKHVVGICGTHDREVPNVEGLLRWHRESFVKWRYGLPVEYKDDEGTVRKTEFLADFGPLAIVLQAIIRIHRQLCGDGEVEQEPQGSEPQTGLPPQGLLKATYCHQKMVYPHNPGSKLTFEEWKQDRYGR